MTPTAVPRWTGGLALALQEALRLSQEAFAAQLNVYPRTVAKWRQRPDRELRPLTKACLDTVLERADAQARQRFELLASELVSVPLTNNGQAVADGSAADAVERELVRDPHVRAALAWLDEAASWDAGTARRAVAHRLSDLATHTLHDRRQRQSRVTQQDIADALGTYYADDDATFALYSASCAGRALTTSVLSTPGWLDLHVPLGVGNESIRYAAASGPAVTLDDFAASAAVQRLAESVAMGTRLVNAPLYRLSSIKVERSSLAGAVSIVDFVEYALTLDLLEAELVDAISAGQDLSRDTLPLRSRYLPTLASVLDIGHRLCVGGVLALCAIARPANARRPKADYVLLVQERSGQVLNAARRLAVIPKAFHGPLVDYREDAQFSTTLEREMEEELFGRDEVDSALDNPLRGADPMHLTRLSDPMRWLVSNTDQWRMECTGFGYNLVSGNFECAALIVVDDESWWDHFGGAIEANWESSGLRRYSTADPDAMTELIHDTRWSNEGLFAMLQGLQRLSELDSARVDLPAVKVEV
jgi:hypothetical protein